MSFEKRTINTFPELTRICSDVLASMWIMKDELEAAVKTTWEKKELPPYQQFISIYFFRNMVYLRGAYLLAGEGSCGPSRNLQRTVYEMILRSYLFIVDKSEADLLYLYLEGDTKAKDTLRKRNFYPIDFLRSKLYNSSSIKSHEKIYEEISFFSHPTIRGTMLDLLYSNNDVEDCLKMILAFTYGSVQVFVEGFYDLLDKRLKTTAKETLEKIASFLKTVPLFEPDQDRWSPKIRLKEGNFLNVL